MEVEEAVQARRREQMVVDQVVRRGVRDTRVLEALRRIPRHAFVPHALRARAYRDEALPIGHGQALPEAWTVGRMAEAAGTGPGRRILEIGTGSGYLAAVLASAGADVVSVELVPELAEAAARLLGGLGLPVRVHVGDGALGWPAAAPYDAVVVGGAVRTVPPALLDQLAPGGRIVAAVGGEGPQELVVLERAPEGFRRRRLGAVRFRPLTVPEP